MSGNCCYATGDRVTAIAIHITSYSECARCYGSKKNIEIFLGYEVSLLTNREVSSQRRNDEAS